jgi:hypothetical protein
MPKKTGAKTSRTRTSSANAPRAPRQTRPAPRPSAAIPVDTPASAVEAVTLPRAPVADVPVAEPRPPVRAGSLSRPAPAARPPSRLGRSSRAASLPLITDYSYVMTDLRRIGVLALGAFIILGALTFVIH